MEKKLTLKCRLIQSCSYQGNMTHPFCCYDCDRSEGCEDKCANAPNKCGQAYAYRTLPRRTPECYEPDKVGECTLWAEHDIYCRRCKCHDQEGEGTCNT